MRVVLRVAAVLVLVAALGLSGAATGFKVEPANAATAYSPKTGAIFNNPTVLGEHRNIVDHVEQSIASAPAGAVVRIALYSFDLDTSADVIVAAHQRGVHIRMIMDDHYMTPQWQRVVDEVGSDTTAESFAITCHGSCMVDKESSFVHLKLYMFSTAGSSKLVSMVASSNLTRGQVNSGWNDIYTFVGDRTMYDSYKLYFEDMTAAALGLKNPFYYRMTLSGKFKTYLSPRGEQGYLNDTVYEILGNVSCKDAAKGYGTKDGRTIIKINMYGWTTGRKVLAKRLWKLSQRGCSVGVIYYGGSTDEQVLAELTKPGPEPYRITVLESARDIDQDGILDTWTHNKYFLINGSYYGAHNKKIVFAGSHNFTYNAMHYNQDILIKVDDPVAYASYRAQFETFKAFLAKTPPPVIVPDVETLSVATRDQLDLDD